jgi:hypothetical protein
MEEANELADYLPLSFNTPKEQEYIEIYAVFDIADETAAYDNFPGIESLH